MSFNAYLDKIKGNVRQAIKVEWLNYDESVNFEFTNSLYDINVDLSVNYQNGSRRTCTLTLNNSNNLFPVGYNGIWVGQKFKLWMGIYLDDGTPYYIPQGVFYVSNPQDVYKPSMKTLKINGVDKWAYLDGTLHGVLSGTYQTNVGVNLYKATRDLLNQTTDMGTYAYKNIDDESDDSLDNYFNFEYGSYRFARNGNTFKTNNNGQNNTTAKTTFVAKKNMVFSFKYSCNSEWYCDKFSVTLNGGYIVDGLSGTENGVCEQILSEGDSIIFTYSKDDAQAKNGDYVEISNIRIAASEEGFVVDPVPPMLSPYYINRQTTIPQWNEDAKKYEDVTFNVLSCPYKAVVEAGKTYADILLEYATILCAHIYYDVNGRLTIEPMINDADDITDTNKDIIWDYTVDEKVFLGLTQTYNFDKIYNDIIVKGNVVNGMQFKARVQNRNLMSDTCIQKIGQKTKPPYEDNQYYSNEHCKNLAIYYAKTDTILQKSGNIDSMVLYHLDVNKIVTVSTPNNKMSKELFLVTGFSIGSSGTMSVNITSINVLNDFSVVGG